MKKEKKEEQLCPKCRFPCGKGVILRTSRDILKNYKNSLLPKISLAIIKAEVSKKELLFCRLCGADYFKIK